MELPATSGGGFSVTSFSSTAPTGISIVSDNVYEGALNVVGELPFVGTSGLEGVVNTAGSGAINHACGNGHNAMVRSDNFFYNLLAFHVPLYQIVWLFKTVISFCNKAVLRSKSASVFRYMFL